MIIFHSGKAPFFIVHLAMVAMAPWQSVGSSKPGKETKTSSRRFRRPPSRTRTMTRRAGLQRWKLKQQMEKDMEYPTKKTLLAGFECSWCYWDYTKWSYEHWRYPGLTRKASEKSTAKPWFKFRKRPLRTMKHAVFLRSRIVHLKCTSSWRMAVLQISCQIDGKEKLISEIETMLSSRLAEFKHHPKVAGGD